MMSNVSERFYRVVRERVLIHSSWVDYIVKDAWEIHNACDEARVIRMKQIPHISSLTKWVI